MVIIIMAGCNRSRDRIDIGIIAPSTNHLPLLVALENGLISNDEVKIHRFLSGWETNEALIGGRIDLAIMPFTYAWQAISEGKELKILSFLERESDGIISRKEIEHIEDLEGKRIGVLRASTLDIFLFLVIDELKIEPEVIYFRTPTEMSVALNNGYVDALSFYVPPIFEFDDRFHILFWYSQLFPEHPCCDIIVNENSLETNAKQIDRLLKAILEGCEMLNNEPEQGVSIIVEQFGYDAITARKSLTQQKFIGGLEKEGQLFQERATTKMTELGYLRKRVDKEKVYYDNSEKD